MASTDKSLSDTEPEQLLHVYTDIETDSFRANQLLQIAAITQNGLTFNTFINPQGPLLLSTVNFLQIYYYKGDLYRKGLKLQTKTTKEALIDFMSWIQDLNKPVILVYHNGFSFDCSVLVRHLLSLKIAIPSNLVKVGDTLPFFRTILKPPEVENHKLSTLSHYFGINQDMAHDALSDSITLKLICEKFVADKGADVSIIFKNCTRNIQDYVNKQLHDTPIPKLKTKNIKTQK